MIVLENVTKAFGNRTVLHDVSFSVGAGEVACLIGPSGSGKSTILRCINGLETRDAGRIEVDGREVTPATLPEIRRMLGMVFQRFNLFPHRTALENVMEGPLHVLHRPAAEVREQATALLEKVGMAEHANKLPRQLSGGQQQRVGIARALAMQPRAILFDEPTSALDAERVGEVLKVMRELADEGMTMIVVTHELDFARKVADMVLFADEGRIVERGSPEQVLSAPKTERARAFLTRVLEPL